MKAADIRLTLFAAAVLLLAQYPAYRLVVRSSVPGDSPSVSKMGNSNAAFGPVCAVQYRHFEELTRCRASLEPGQDAQVEALLHVPGSFYGRVAPGTTQVRLAAPGRAAAVWPVARKSPFIDPATQEFEVTCLLPRNDDWAIPGGRVDMDLIVTERRGLGIPTGSLFDTRDGIALLALDGPAIHPVPVKTGLAAEGWTEVEGEGLVEGTPVLLNGAQVCSGQTSGHEVSESFWRPLLGPLRPR